MPPPLKNISLRIFRKYLESKGLKIIRTTGGHEVWGGKSLQRPITIQSHVDPVPAFIVRNAFKCLGVDQDDFIHFFDA
jgi:hypothetical protein